MKISEAKTTLITYMEAKYYRDDTIKTYVSAVVGFFGYLATRPDIAGLPHVARVEKYLTWRVQEHDIAPSTQNVELNALVMFHRILGVELSGVNALRARRRDRIPPILSREQVLSLIENIQHDYKLIPMILYGCGMRINECLRLRLKDVNLSMQKFSIHEAKGDKERIVHIPQSLMPLVKVQYEKSISLWKIDIYHKFNGVNCGGIEKKYPAYPLSQEWYWLFPAASLSTHPKTHVPMMRHHIMDWSVQRAFEDVRRRAALPVYTTPHVLRHACLTHMAVDLIAKGFTETMIRAELKKLSGHVMDETLEGYIHLATPRNAFVVSPIEGLV